MGSSSELSLDYKPIGYSMTTQKLSGDQGDQTQKIEEFIARLEEERVKIDAFKRELPLCMQLLNNAMECYRQQLETYNTNQGPRPVLEEFIPIKHMGIDGSEKAANTSSEKASWMVSAQLWSPANDTTKQLPVQKEADRGFDVSPKLALDGKPRNGGAFLPFSKERNKGVTPASRALPDLALAPSEKNSSEMDKGAGSGPRRDNCSKGGGGATAAVAEQGKEATNSTEGQAASQTHRKARRCWSPDLHRRFVNALQMLGGSQVATPKQIRELMKVDGLTNDEVKSHLQKYRLHTRRPMTAPQASAAAAPQLVVLGGIWVPPEYATSAAAGTAIYGAHPAQAHYCATPIPQDFYPAPPHHHHHHHSLHRRTVVAGYKGRHGSPESDLGGGGERSESIEEEEEGEEREEEEEEEEEAEEEEEEEKSEDSNWKGEEKALVPLRPEAESNGSDVTLKF